MAGKKVTDPALLEQLNGAGASAAPALRPFKPGEERPNADGTHSTELSTTWQLPDGSWANVPSLWMGKDGPVQMDAGDEDGILGAMKAFEASNGPTFPRFKTLEEAEAAAQVRSSKGGAAVGGKKVTDPALLEQLNAPARKPGERDKGIFGLPVLTPGVDAGFQSPEVAGQALSGVNEGIADMASLPATVANAALSIGPAAVNALTGSKFNVPLVDQATKGQSWVPDPGVPARSLMETTGMIKPESDDPGLRAIRRVGKEVGAMVPFLGASRSVSGGLNMLKGAVGSGTGAAVAEAVAPGNPVAELVGQTVGGLGPSAVTGAVKRAAAQQTGPTLNAIRAERDAAYAAVDNLGVKYTPDAYKRLVGEIETAVTTGANHLSPTRHKAAFDFLEEIKGRYGKGLSLTELDQLRQEMKLDLLSSPDASIRHYGQEMVDTLDDFIARAGTGDVSSGTAGDASDAIRAAREAHARVRKTELIEQAIDKADLQAASTGSGGNINNATRQKLRQILDNPKKRRGFSEEELAAIEDVVRQGKVEGILRLAGKLSPSGNGLSLLTHLAGTSINPGWLVVPATGLASKSAADAITSGKTKALRALVARGRPVDPAVSADTLRSLPALSAVQAANQNEPPQIRALQRTTRLNALN